jgi:hypothetical protein
MSFCDNNTTWIVLDRLFQSKHFQFVNVAFASVPLVFLSFSPQFLNSFKSSGCYLCNPDPGTIFRFHVTS